MRAEDRATPPELQRTRAGRTAELPTGHHPRPSHLVAAEFRAAAGVTR
ncbi:hypothetical protein AB0C12_07080 [Actinoplanes sp. NPDC048967]